VVGQFKEQISDCKGLTDVTMATVFCQNTQTYFGTKIAINASLLEPENVIITVSYT